MTLFPFGLTLIPRAEGPSVDTLPAFWLGSRRSGKTETWAAVERARESRMILLVAGPRRAVLPRAFYETHVEVR